MTFQFPSPEITCCGVAKNFQPKFTTAQVGFELLLNIFIEHFCGNFQIALTAQAPAH